MTPVIEESDTEEMDENDETEVLLYSREEKKTTKVISFQASSPDEVHGAIKLHFFLLSNRLL